MTAYLGRHAQLYDLFYGQKPYQAEAAFVASLIERHAGPPGTLLDVACGTGAHAFAFEALGFDVTGVDASADMLAVAVDSASSRSSSVRFEQVDMRELALGRTFDAATCLFDSLGYVATNEGVLAALRSIWRHLRPGGLFVYEVWHAAGMLAGHDPLRVRHWRTADADVLRISETTVDVARQTATVHFDIYEHRDDETYVHLQETQENRFFMAQELNALLEQAGLEPVAVFGGFAEDAPVDDRCFHLVGIARA